MNNVPVTKLTWLNRVNGADRITYEYCRRIMALPTDNLCGAILGSAYGGELEALAKLWKGRGTIHGFDTFEGHPKHLVVDQENFEATCMDSWYEQDVGTKTKLSYGYQREELDRMGLDNVLLHKGLVHKDSLKDIPALHYCLLDMDIYESMKTGYEAVKDKILPGFLLFLHDAIPATHIPRVNKLLFKEILRGKDKNMWEVVEKWEQAYLVALVKR